MTRLLTTLLAAALVSCSVALDPGDLAPKTQADCAPEEKACGSRCVNRGDPATGCGGASCEACAADPGAVHTVPACGLDGECALACEAGWGDCSPDLAGCETALVADAANCGACGHACGGLTCDAGTCEPTPYVTVGGTPRGLVQLGGTVYWLDDQNDGSLWGPGGDLIAPGLGAGGIGLLTTRPLAGLVYASGTHPFDSTLAVVWEIDPVLRASTQAAAHNAAPLSGVAADGARVYLTARDSTSLESELLGGLGSATLELGAPGEDVAFSPLGGWVAAGGEVAPLVSAGASGPPTLGAAVAVGSGRRARLAVGLDAGAEVVYVAYEDAGDVWRYTPSTEAVVQLWDGPADSPMTIVADDEGACWTSAVAGQVVAYRAADGAVFPIAVGPRPVAVVLAPASAAPVAYWADETTRAIASVPR